MKSIPRTRSHNLRIPTVSDSVGQVRFVSSAGSSLSSVVGFGDSFSSLIGVFRSIFANMAEKERSKQLLVQIDAMTTELNLYKKTLENKRLIRFEEMAQNEELFSILKLRYQGMGERLKSLKKLLEEHRACYPDSNITKKLEQAYLSTITEKAKCSKLFTKQ